MKKYNLFMLSLLLLFFFPGLLFSYELSLYNIEVPSSLEKSTSEFVIRHRFYGVATEDPLDNFFGIDQGANVSVGLKYVIVNGLEADISYTRDHNEYTLGLAYSHSFPEVFLRSRADVEFFSFEELGADESMENFFYQLVFQGEALEGRIKPLVGAGYDGYNERFGFAVGLSAILVERVGNVRDMSFLGEFFPVDRDEDSPFLGRENCYTFGLGFRTWGHQFLFLLGNSSEIGPRHLMLGTQSDDLFFGFTIRRLLTSE